MCDLEDEEDDEDDEDGVGQFVGHLDVVLLAVSDWQHLAGGDLAEHHPVPAILPAHHLPASETRRMARSTAWVLETQAGTFMGSSRNFSRSTKSKR